MTDKQAPPLAKHHLPLDREIALKYATYLVEKRIADTPQTRRDFCAAAGFHPKLLYHNPHIGALARLFQDQSDRKSTRLNSSHIQKSRMPSSA